MDFHKMLVTHDVDLRTCTIAPLSSPGVHRDRGAIVERFLGGCPSGDGRAGGSRRTPTGSSVPAVRSRRRFRAARTRRCRRERGWSGRHPCQQCGHLAETPALGLDPVDWSQVIAVNLTAPVLLATIAARGMADRGYGRIVNVTSIHGRFAAESALAYAAAKAGWSKPPATSPSISPPTLSSSTQWRRGLSRPASALWMASTSATLTGSSASMSKTASCPASSRRAERGSAERGLAGQRAEHLHHRTGARRRWRSEHHVLSRGGEYSENKPWTSMIPGRSPQ